MYYPVYLSNVRHGCKIIFPAETWLFLHAVQRCLYIILGVSITHGCACTRTRMYSQLHVRVHKLSCPEKLFIRFASESSLARIFISSLLNKPPVPTIPRSTRIYIRTESDIAKKGNATFNQNHTRLKEEGR